MIIYAPQVRSFIFTTTMSNNITLIKIKGAGFAPFIFYAVFLEKPVDK